MHITGYKEAAMRISLLLIALLVSLSAMAESPGRQVLVMHMADTQAKPWCQFVVTFPPDNAAAGNTATLGWYEYPFCGAEIVPVLRTEAPFAATNLLRKSLRRIYAEWGADGDAAYMSVREQRDGSWKGLIAFPTSNGPRAYRGPNGGELPIVGKMYVEPVPSVP